MSRRHTRVSETEERAQWAALLSAQAPPQLLVPIRSDGNCLFSAFAHSFYGSSADHMKVRRIAVDYMSNHPAEFEEFLSPAGKEAFKKYLQLMRKEGVWGGHLELKALHLTFRVNIAIYRLGLGAGHRKEGPGGDADLVFDAGPDHPTVSLAFSTKHNEHYSSVIQAEGHRYACEWPEAGAEAEGAAEAPVAVADLDHAPPSSSSSAPVKPAIEACKAAPSPLEIPPSSGSAPVTPEPPSLSLHELASLMLTDPEPGCTASTQLLLGKEEGGDEDGAGGELDEAQESKEEGDREARARRVIGAVYRTDAELDAMDLAALKELYLAVMKSKTRLRTAWKVADAIRAAWKVEIALGLNEQDV